MVRTEFPIVQAPMAGANGAELVIAVSEAGGLGSLPCATLSGEQIRAEVARIREKTSKPFNLNFFCHPSPVSDPRKEDAWRKRLEPYYLEFSVDPSSGPSVPMRQPFNEKLCDLVLELKPQVVSFHFGLPAEALVSRLKSAGIEIWAAATTVDEALWLEARGCDVVIAQGFEAGGHRGNFLSQDISTQVGTMALVPQIVDAVKVPVVASGGIGDARGIVAALALGASAVQLGTAYLFCPEAKILPAHLKALQSAKETALTNVFSGRPARGIVNRLMREVGPISELAPDFPTAGLALAALKTKTEASGDFMSLWSGQAARLAKPMPAGELTRTLAEETSALLGRLSVLRDAWNR